MWVSSCANGLRVHFKLPVSGMKIARPEAGIATATAAALFVPTCLTGFICGFHIAYSYNDSRLN